MELNRQTIITANEVDTTNIVSGTLSLSEILCEGDIKFGKFCVDMFECQIYDDSDSIEDYTGKSIVVRVNSNDVEKELVALVDGNTVTIVNDRNDYITVNAGDFTDVLFTGVVDSCKTDFTNTYREIVAYSFVRQEENIIAFWNSFWNEHTTSTLKTLRQALVTYMGLTEVTKTLYNDTLTISPSSATSLTFEYVMSSICELQLCFPHINRNGELEYITLGNNTWDLTDKYELNNSTWDSLNVGAITGIAVYSTSDDFTVATSNVTNPYIISGNLFFVSKTTSSIRTIINGMLTKIQQMDLTYRPCDLSMIVSDFDIKLGDKITYEGNTSYVMSNRLYGTQYVNQEIKCTGSIVRDKKVETINNAVVEGFKRSAIEQTADMIRWIVESGTSASSFTLTDRTADLVAQYFNISGNVHLNGSLLTGSIQSLNGNTNWNLNTGEFQMRTGSVKLGSTYKSEMTNNGVTNYYRQITSGTDTQVGMIDGSASIYDTDEDRTYYGIKISAPYTYGVIAFDSSQICVRLGGSGSFTSVPSDQTISPVVDITTDSDGRVLSVTRQPLRFMNGWLTTRVSSS